MKIKLETPRILPRKLVSGRDRRDFHSELRNDGIAISARVMWLINRTRTCDMRRMTMVLRFIRERAYIVAARDSTKFRMTGRVLR